jgi:hypothetical protein
MQLWGAFMNVAATQGERAGSRGGQPQNGRWMPGAGA